MSDTAPVMVTPPRMTMGPTIHKPRTRRKSNSLGEDPRGDTGAPALATLDSPAVKQHNQTQQQRTHSKRRKARSLLRQSFKLVSRHTWIVPLAIVLVVLTLYLLNPTPSNPLHACIFLSYPLPRPANAAPDTPIQYAKGRADFAFVAFYTIVLSFSRECLMQCVIRPLAMYCGIRRKAKQYRFMEQVYTAIYFGILGPFGLYVMRRTQVWYFDTTGMFAGYPHRTHDALFKAYYLIQASYWAQQAVVLLLMLERPRKDFKELVLHHIITLTLIWCSYRFHYTHLGIAVYITHDISDFFLATSKTLNYLDSPITAPYFAFFVAVWIYLRHYLNLHILWAVLTKFRTIPPFELDFAKEEYKGWIANTITFVLLTSLQAVNLFWLYLIFRIMKRVMTAKVLADERSEDETEEDTLHSLDDAKKPDSASSSPLPMNRAQERPQVLLNGSPFDEDATIADETNGSLRKRRKA